MMTRKPRQPLAPSTKDARATKSQPGSQPATKRPLRRKDNNIKRPISKIAANTFVDALTSAPPSRGAVTRAARQAYPDQKRASAAATGSRLLKAPYVRALIQTRLERAAEFANITRQQMVGMLVQSANSSIGDVADLLDSDGNLNWAEARARGVDQTIRQFEVTERHSTIGNISRRRVTTKVKLVDSLKAADLLADIQGLKKQAAKNPIDSARESYEIMRHRPEYADLPDAELAKLAQESHGLPSSAVMDILSGAVKR